jgi:hypothetical protein
MGAFKQPSLDTIATALDALHMFKTLSVNDAESCLHERGIVKTERWTRLRSRQFAAARREWRTEEPHGLFQMPVSLNPKVGGRVEGNIFAKAGVQKRRKKVIP